jgi:acetate kinase
MAPAPAPAALVLNAGSSSLKAAVISAAGAELWRGQQSWSPEAEPGPLLQGWLLPALEPWRGVIVLAGHRVVHGGERFSGPTPLDAEVRAAIDALLPLAPLHQRSALAWISGLAAAWPELPQWACFDTAFHHTLPVAASTYALPARWRQLGLRRFGFHGLNHQHVAETVARRHPAAASGPLRLISCHLGAGCSLCAIAAGRSLATTMGFTPLDGLVMATRSGAIDPGVLFELVRRGVAVAEVERVLAEESGLLGLSGWSADMRELRRAAADGADPGHDGARLAIAVFRQRLLEQIGAMAASLGGVDVVALSGGIGEHDTALCSELQSALAWLEPFSLEVVPADEEGQIASSCLEGFFGFR